MPRLIVSADTLNPHVDRVMISDGYELCARCGQPILNGEPAFVMWRSRQYGCFAHTSKCCSRQPRNWTKILKYEQANETLTWNSERVPAFASRLNPQSALATKPAEPREYEWERAGGRKNRFTWVFAPGNSNWVRFDRKTGMTSADPSGGSKVVIEGREFPFVSLLDWEHIQSAASIVDIELPREYPAKFPGAGEDSDGIPSDEKAKQRTAIAIHDSDNGMDSSGLTAVTRRIVCQNREEQKMIERLSTAKSPVARALEKIVYASVIRNERARSYGTGRTVRTTGFGSYFVGFGKTLTSAAMKYYIPRPKLTGNGPGEAQSWDALGRAVERAFYADPFARVMDNGRWRKLRHSEWVEWELRARPGTLIEIPARTHDSESWKRLIFTRNDLELAALINFWTALGNSALGSWIPAYERPWQWMGRESHILVSQDDRGDGILLTPEMASPSFLLEGGLTAPF